MSDFSLVPVDHQPDFTDVSLIPVDHDPFSVDEAPQQAGRQLDNPPQPLATGPGLPDVGPPAIDDGGQFSPGIPFVNKAAEIASKVAYAKMVQAATLPQRAIDASKEDVQHYGEVASTSIRAAIAVQATNADRSRDRRPPAQQQHAQNTTIHRYAKTRESELATAKAGLKATIGAARCGSESGE